MTEQPTGRSEARGPLEYRVSFAGPNSWLDWKTEHPEALSTDIRRSMQRSLKARGITAHPLGHSVPPKEIRIDQQAGGDIIHLRETSAHRALLEAFRELCGREPEYARRRAKIFASGLLRRHVGQLRRRQPFVFSELDFEVDDRGQAPLFDLIVGCLAESSRGEMEAKLSEWAAQSRCHGRLLFTAPFAADSPGGKAAEERLSWPIVDKLRRAGFQTVDVLWYASESKGILGIDTNGTFVIDARRESPGDSVASGEEGGLISLIGLPRSGTTMLTALLGAHTDIHAVYEPWNSYRAKYENHIGGKDIASALSFDPFDLNVGEFRAEMGIERSPKPWLLVKETTTVGEYADAIEGLLSKPPRPARQRLIWLVRSPFHVYLSDIEARKKWWGVPDIEHSRELFQRWARRSLRSFGWLFRLSRRFDGWIVSYEALTSDTESTLRNLMDCLEIGYQPHQLEYHKSVEKTTIRGDWSLASNPREVSNQSVIARQNEFDALKGTISAVQEFEEIAKLSCWVDELALRGVITAGDSFANVLEEIQEFPPRRPQS